MVRRPECSGSAAAIPRGRSMVGGRASHPSPADRSRIFLGQQTSLLMKPILPLFRVLAVLGPLAGSAGALKAEECRVEEVPLATSVGPAQLKGRTIAFSDHREDKLTDPGTGLISFEDWGRARPVQKQFLSP